MKWAFFILLLLSASLAASPYLVIDLDKTSIAIDSGGLDSLLVSIRNPNQQNTTLTIALLGEINSWGTIDESELFIPAGEIASTTLYVGSPTAAAAGTYGMTLSASGKAGEEAVSKSKTFSVRVKKDEDFRLSFQKDHTALSPKGTLKMTLNMENAGNVPYASNLVLKIDGEVIDERPISFAPRSAELLIIPYTVPNTLSPGEKKISLSVSTKTKVLASTNDTITINVVSKVTEEKVDEKGFWYREITYALENEGNTREVKEINLEFSSLEQAFMSSSLTPTNTAGNAFTWKIALLPGETETLSILTYGTVLYIAYLLILVIILLSASLTYTKVINKPPVDLEKTIIGVSRKEDKNEIVIGIYIKNKSGKTFRNVTLTDSVSSFFDVKKYESLSPDQVNERDADIEYIWNFKEMKPFEERTIVYHMVGRGAISLKPATIRFQAGSKTFFKKTGKVAVTG